MVVAFGIVAIIAFEQIVEQHIAMNSCCKLPDSYVTRLYWHQAYEDKHIVMLLKLVKPFQ